MQSSQHMQTACDNSSADNKAIAYNPIMQNCDQLNLVMTPLLPNYVNNGGQAFRLSQTCFSTSYFLTPCVGNREYIP